MSLQGQAAQSLELALAQLKLGANTAHTSDGVEVSVAGHPEVTVYFKLNQLGGLRTKIVADDGKTVGVDYAPTTLMAMELAQMVNDRLHDEP